jgi:hypothetical protein
LGHNYTAVVSAPTCTAAGYTTHTCEVCGDSYADSYVDATGHNYVDGSCEHCGLAQNNPPTADAFSYLWVLLMLLSVASLSVLTVARKKY